MTKLERILRVLLMPNDDDLIDCIAEVMDKYHMKRIKTKEDIDKIIDDERRQQTMLKHKDLYM